MTNKISLPFHNTYFKSVLAIEKVSDAIVPADFNEIGDGFIVVDTSYMGKKIKIIAFRIGNSIGYFYTENGVYSGAAAVLETDQRIEIFRHFKIVMPHDN